MLAFLAEMAIELLGQWVVARAYWLARPVGRLALYPWLLLAGWGQFWLRERGRLGWLALRYLAAALLLALAAGGVVAVLVGLGQQIGL